MKVFVEKTVLNLLIDVISEIDIHGYYDVSYYVEAYRVNKDQINTSRIKYRNYAKTVQEANEMIDSWEIENCNDRSTALMYLMKTKEFTVNKRILLFDDVARKLGYKFDEKTCVIYDENRIRLCYIDTINTYIKCINENISNDKIIMYRGHEDINYRLIPSLYRSDNLRRNESSMYMDLMLKCPEEFIDDIYSIDKLSRMQHYKMPTKLLDLTNNSLVALYFACCGKKRCGEVMVFDIERSVCQYAYGERVTNIANDSFIINKDKQYMIESKNTRAFLISPTKKNKRISAQEGAFFIYDDNIHMNEGVNPNEARRMIENKKMVYLVTNKSKIINELSLVGINDSTIFPEIDYVSEFIKKKYNGESK